MNKNELCYYLENDSSLQAVAKNPFVRLNLGCGDKILPGYINIDAAPSRGGKSPDFIADLRDLSKVKAAIVNEILAVHVIEHFYY